MSFYFVIYNIYAILSHSIYLYVPQEKQHIIVAMVSNKIGVLNQITSLLRRRRFQLVSLTVGQTQNPAIVRMTFVVKKDAEQFIKQLYKIIHVIKVSEITNDEIIVRETLLIKVNATNSNRAEINDFADVFKTKTIDISPSSLVFELTSHPETIDAFVLEMKRFGIKEMVRTGITAMNRRRSGEIKMKL